LSKITIHYLNRLF